MRRFIYILFLLIYSSLSYAQEYSHYTTIDGLSGTDVTAICENENFLWIATNDGLNRFDGREFKVYRNDNSVENSLTENNLETLMFDSNGLLWIGFKTGGVDIFNPRKNKFTHISEIMKDFPQRVICIYEDSQKNIWLGSWDDGLYQLTPSKEGDLSYIVTRHYPGNIISSIIEKPKGKLWIGTYYGYYLYDIENKREIPVNKSSASITQFLDTGEKNSLWFSTWTDGLNRLEWEDNTFVITEKPVNKNAGDVYRIFPAANNRLYLGTWGGGIKIAGLQGENLTHISNIEAPVIFSFFRDHYSRLWIGTYGAGLYRLNDESRGITNLSPINENGFSVARALRYFGNNHLLVGTQGNGLYLYDLEKRELKPKPVNSSGSLFHQYILSLYTDNEVVIVGNDDVGIQYAPLKDRNLNFSLRTFQSGKGFGKVTSILRARNSQFWFGTKQFGLVSMKYDSLRGEFTEYIHYDSFGMDEITGFAEAVDGQIWVSSHSGIYLFDPSTNKAEKYGQGISEMVYSIVDDKKNKCLWLGTSGGLRKLNYSERNDKIEKVFPSEMLPSGAIRDVVLDAYNYLWFSVSDRVFCYVDNRHELKEINPGVINKQLLFSSAQCEVNGKQYIVFGGTDNLMLIDPQTVLNQPNHTKILLTELQVDHQVVNVGDKVYGDVILNEDTEYTNSITLSYRCKWISLSFTEVGWDNYHNSYQYQIKGFSDDWQFLDVSKPITFSQLPPGEYTLLIRPNESVSSTADKPFWSLDIVITPPWWKTNLFYLLLFSTILLILLCMFFMIQNYYKKRQAQRLEEIEKRKKEELLQEKESFFAGLSHDLLTPFSLIIAPISDLMRDKDVNEDQREKLEIISKNASYLSDIFGTILDFKRVELLDTEIKEKDVELVSFVQIIVDAFEYLAKSNLLELSFRSDAPKLYISIDTIKLERVLYNLISNALKFTKEDGTVQVLLLYDEASEYFHLKIKDNGIGINPENREKVFEKFYQEERENNSEGLGLGLYTTRKFVQMMGGEVHIELEQQVGTTITLSLPAKKAKEALLLPEKEEYDAENISTILLVEDNAQLRDYLKKKLSAHFEVSVASDGMEALDYIKNNLPEIVISDVMMPVMGGLALCSTIKNTPMYSDIFVILLSAKSSAEDERKGYKAGADFYVKKPFDPDILINQMVNVYATRQQRKKQIISDILSPQSDNADYSPKDEFLHKAIKIIEEHLMDENFKIDEFASEMNLSKTVLHRKFKLMVGETPNIFIRNIRLRKAANMLKETDLSISEIAYMTGFSQSHYFIKCFKELYKDTPKNFRINNKSEGKS